MALSSPGKRTGLPNLCITLANTWGNKEDGIKTDKLTYDGRVEFARNFLKELEPVARDPMSLALE